jgi:hypothetical protein
MKFEVFEAVSARMFKGACIKRLNNNCGWTTITKLQYMSFNCYIVSYLTLSKHSRNTSL